MKLNGSRTIPATLLAFLIFGLAGCANSTAKESSTLIAGGSAAVQPAVQQGAKAPVKTIGLVMKTLTNPFFIEMEKGARKAQSELGINLVVKTGAQETSIEQQISIVEDMIQSKVDGIVIAPGSSTELVPVLKKAQSAGIPIVNIDNRLDKTAAGQIGLTEVPFISVDNVKGAYLSAKFVADQIGIQTDVAILEGIRAAQNAQDRKTGALKAFEENRNVKLVATETANWKIDEADDVTAKIYRQYPNIGAFFCANDMMALGTIHYLDRAGKKGVLVGAFDALEEAKTAIGQGKMAVTIDQQADVQGYTGVMYAMRAIRGEKLPPETMVDVKVITSSSLR